MYPVGSNASQCNNAASKVTIKLVSPSGTTLKNTIVTQSTNAGFNFYTQTNLPAGLYTMKVTFAWTAGVDVPDYTVRAYTD